MAVNVPKKRLLLAIDVGATSMKAVPALKEEEGLTFLEISGKESRPLCLNGTEYIDIPAILDFIFFQIRELSREYDVVSVGIDTYGNGYGIADKAGRVLQQPYYYRDRRVDSILTYVMQYFSEKELYELFGNFPIKTRGLFHLYKDILDRDPVLHQGGFLIPFPNFLEYLLTGKIGAERSICSVLYMLDKNGNDWNYPVFRKLGIPTDIFPAVCEAGEDLGKICFSREGDQGSKEMPNLIRVLGHDTESALLTVPSMNESSLFVCLGTSFIFGTRRKKILVNDMTYRWRFKNIRGAGDNYSLCKDFPGFWILERCIDLWKKKEPDLSYSLICRRAAQCKDNRTYLDINQDEFRVSESDILDVIRNYCIRTGQEVPQGVGETARCLMESYCLYLRWNAEKLSAITGNQYEVLYAFNGGVRNHYLMQMFADCMGIKVIAQSPMASAIGNLMIQQHTLYGSSLSGTAMEGQSTIYYSYDTDLWDQKFIDYKKRNILEEERNGQAN